MNSGIIQYETDLLGSIVKNGMTLDAVEIIDKLTPECFIGRWTKELFITIKRMNTNNDIINVTTVCAEIEKNIASGLSAFGYATSDIVDIIKQSYVSPPQYKAYAKKIRQAMFVRETIKTLSEAQERLSSGGDINDIANDVSQMLSGISLETDRKLPRSLAEIAKEYPDELEKREAPSAFDTPFTDMSKAMGRVNKEDMIVLAARPSMGKTELAAAIANHVSKTGSVYFASMEMSDIQVFERIVSINGNFSGNVLRNFFDHDDTQQARALASVGGVVKNQCYIQDISSMTIADIEKDVEYVKRKTSDLNLICIDYFGLLKTQGNANRAQELGEISRNIKQLAKRIKTPILLLAQLNRQLEQRPDKHPKMSDLRETGDLEQDADQIIFIYRDEVYNPETNYKGIAEVYWGKQRFGDLSKSKCLLTFNNGHFNSFAGDNDDYYNSFNKQEQPRAQKGFDG